MTEASTLCPKTNIPLCPESQRSHILKDTRTPPIQLSSHLHHQFCPFYWLVLLRSKNGVTSPHLLKKKMPPLELHSLQQTQFAATIYSALFYNKTS